MVKAGSARSSSFERFIQMIGMSAGLLGVFWTIPAAHALGTTYELQVDLSMNGKKIAAPHLTVEEGKKTTLTKQSGKEKTFFEILASPSQVKELPGVLLEMTVGRLDAQGKRVVLASPRVVARENEPSELIIQEGEESQILSLSILAREKVPPTTRK